MAPLRLSYGTQTALDGAWTTLHGAKTVPDGAWTALHGTRQHLTVPGQHVTARDGARTALHGAKTVPDCARRHYTAPDGT